MQTIVKYSSGSEQHCSLLAVPSTSRQSSDRSAQRSVFECGTLLEWCGCASRRNRRKTSDCHKQPDIVIDAPSEDALKQCTVKRSSAEYCHSCPNGLVNTEVPPILTLSTTSISSDKGTEKPHSPILGQSRLLKRVFNAKFNVIAFAGSSSPVTTVHQRHSTSSLIGSHTAGKLRNRRTSLPAACATPNFATFHKSDLEQVRCYLPPFCIFPPQHN